MTLSAISWLSSDLGISHGGSSYRLAEESYLFNGR